MSQFLVIHGGGNSLPLRGGSGLKYHLYESSRIRLASPSARREWIEIYPEKDGILARIVSLCEEGVD